MGQRSSTRLVEAEYIDPGVYHGLAGWSDKWI